MGGIIWIASYPKSGNTWMRAFLANLFQNPKIPEAINELWQFGDGDARADLYERAAGGRPVEELSDQELHRLRPTVHRMIAASRPDTVFVKTHNMVTTHEGIATITPDVTAAAIYIARNPFDVCLSYAHHFELAVDDAIAAMDSDVNYVMTVDRNVFQFLGSWHGHVESWTRSPGLTCHLVRYEDMTRQPLKAFGGVVEFLRLPRDSKRLKKAIRFSSFKVLSEQERRLGFIERSRNSDRFFRSGKVGAWREALSQTQIDRIVETQGDVMRRLGYLDAGGRILC